MAADHPCFSCRLPDCDESSKRCTLRMAINRYESLRTKGQEIPEDVRVLYRLARRELTNSGNAPRNDRRAERVGA